MLRVLKYDHRVFQAILIMTNGNCVVHDVNLRQAMMGTHAQIQVTKQQIVSYRVENDPKVKQTELVRAFREGDKQQNATRRTSIQTRGTSTVIATKRPSIA